MRNKILSTPNLFLFIAFLVIAIKLFGVSLLGYVDMYYHPILSCILVFLSLLEIIIMFVFLYIKFPIYVYKQNFNVNINGEVVKKRIKWWECFYTVLFSLEPSQYISFFAENNIILFKDDNNKYVFTFENKDSKIIHKILDLLLVSIFSGILLLIIFYIKNINNWKFGLAVFIFSVILFFNKRIYGKVFSIMIAQNNKCKIKVMLPKTRNNFISFKFYGLACLKNTILITCDVLNGNKIIYDYIVAHEQGHLKDKKLLLYYISSIVWIAYLSMSPYFFSYIGMRFMIWINFLIYHLYSQKLGYALKIYSENIADVYAVKTLGKEKCLKALQLLNQSHNSNRSNSLFKQVTLQHRIEMIEGLSDV